MRNLKALALNSVSAIALFGTMASSAMADTIVPYAIPLPIIDPNFLVYTGTTPKDAFSAVNPTYWTQTAPSRGSGILTGIDGPNTSQQFGPAPGCAYNTPTTCQPYGIYPSHTAANGTFQKNFVDPGPPTGGNFLQMDGNQQYGSIVSQTINNLVVGQQYYIGFYQASGQQHGTSFTLATTDYWKVYLGGTISVNCRNLNPDGSCPVTLNDPTHTVEWDSPTMDNPAEGSTPWTYVQSNLGGTNGAVTFTAYATTETLSYFAYGTNQGANQPPTLFLSGFNNVNAAPEPVTLGLFGLGLGGLAAARRMRRKTRPGDRTISADAPAPAQ